MLGRLISIGWLLATGMSGGMSGGWPTIWIPSG